MDPLADIKAQLEKAQSAANTFSAAKDQGLDLNKQTTVSEAQGFIDAPQPTPVTDNTGAINAESLTGGGVPEMPEPTAQTEQETFQSSVTEQAGQARTELETQLQAERDAALKRQEELNKRLEKLVQSQNPENRDTFQQEQEILQTELNAAETAVGTIEEDFKKRRKVVNELDKLLSQGNQIVAQAAGAPISRYRSRSVTQTLQGVQARAGVLQAVVSGLDGNITNARNIINDSRNAVASVWQDQLTYNQTYMSLVEDGQLAKDKIESDYAQAQITLAENKLNQLEETKTYIESLMVDPASAQFIADAGITLNDSVEEINQKMQEQSNRDEREDTINQLKMDGFEYVAFAGDRDDVIQLEIGGETLSFVPPVEEVSGGGSSFTPQETRKLEQAGLVNAARQEQLDFLYGGNSKNQVVDLSPTQERNLVGVGFSLPEIKQIQADVAEFGIDEVLNDDDLTDEQKKVIGSVYGKEVKTAPLSSEERKTKIVTTLQNIKNTYTRSEAEELAREQLENAIGSNSLPKTIEDELQDALVEVYGATFWQNIMPGGRGNFPGTPE